METIGIHANADDNSAIIKFVSLDKFPSNIQNLVNNGDFWGAYVDDNWQVIVQDTAHETYETGVIIGGTFPNA